MQLQAQLLDLPDAQQEYVGTLPYIPVSTALLMQKLVIINSARKS